MVDHYVKKNKYDSMHLELLEEALFDKIIFPFAH